jgi:hypothetical protein
VFVGFICNLLIVVVLGRDKTMNKTTRFLLQMLALADIMFYVLSSNSEHHSSRFDQSYILSVLYLLL